MSTKGEKLGNSARRRSKSRRKRHLCLVATAVAIATAVVATTWRAAPRYRATTSLVLEGRTFPLEEGRDSRSQVNALLQTTFDAVATSRQWPEDKGFKVLDVSSSAAGAPELRSVSATFDLYVASDDERASERSVEALAEAYLESFRAATIVPPVSAVELEEARMDVARAGAERERVENALTEFERDNAAALPGLEDIRARDMEEARQERAAVDRQLATLEMRRNELDNALAEMQRGATQFGNASDSALTGEIFMAAQARWAVLRGLYGDDHEPVVELGAALAGARADADARIASVTAELDQARNAYERLQASHPLDHPDVIGLAHRVSALERLYEQTRLPALSSRDLRYTEGLARERREIDLEINAALERRAVLEAQQGQQNQLAERAPLLAERHLFHQDQLATARRRHETAQTHYAALQDELQAASHEQSGTLEIASEAQAHRRVISWPAVVSMLICILCFPVFLLTLRLIERRHRTITGPNMIVQLQGRPPLAQIPELGTS